MTGNATLDFTGERFVPGAVSGDIVFEHYHRYALCLAAAAGRDVLDVACGDGYGAALIARGGQESVAPELLPRSVLGVDIDPAAVAHAATRYESSRPRLSFAAGSCDALPLADDSVDLVTSFETIEHHDKHEEMMQEIRRVLRPGGLLILSSPNRRAYSDAPGYENPFHVRELDRAELEALLSRHFSAVLLFGQRVISGSLITALGKTEDSSFGYWARRDLTTVTDHPGSTEQTEEPTYFIALCAFDAEGIAALERITANHPVASLFVEQGNELAHWSDTVQDEMRRRNAEIEDKLREQAELVQQSNTAREAAQQESDSLRAQLLRMQNSPFWRLRNGLRRLMNRPSDAI